MKSPSSSVSFIRSASGEASRADQWASLPRAAAAAGGTGNVRSFGRKASGRNKGLAAAGMCHTVDSALPGLLLRFRAFAGEETGWIFLPQPGQLTWGMGRAYPLGGGTRPAPAEGRCRQG